MTSYDIKKSMERTISNFYSSSLGSIIGLKLVKEHPEDFYGFIGEGQTADFEAAIREMDRYVVFLRQKSK